MLGGIWCCMGEVFCVRVRLFDLFLCLYVVESKWV